MTESRQSPTHWCQLQHWTLLAITGPQARNFLQGQVTCDVNAADTHTSLLGAHCTPKGRMLFSFRLLGCGEHTLLLRVRQDMQAIVRTSLGKYIQFSKAELEPPQPERVLRGFSGPQARAQLSERWLAPAEQAGQWVNQGDDLLITLGPERFECWLTPETAHTLDSAFAEHHTDSGDALWQLEDIRAGLGEVTPPTSELFTPQALNFPQVGAVNFRKGCYTGQEVVARMHYKGKLKRFMHRLTLDGTPELVPGQAIYAPAPQGETDAKAPRKLAELVACAHNDQGEAECLAVMEALEHESVQIDGSHFAARLLPLPYAME